ncbi:MAG: MotA/TolQ/ExbB proton channel family protein [Deltaproteobacteria bacterium]|nr:MotA/TolQ/ExbB proton channel family protein [Deltaproteobacteria bacterium]
MVDFFLKGGPLMWPILFCSVLALAITIYKAVMFKTLLMQLGRSLNELLESKPEQIQEMLSALVNGAEEKEISLIGGRELRSLEKGVGVLSLIAAIAPLLGLTGTVLGMIECFRMIAIQNGATNVVYLAGGIWEALITTAAGLLVAIPVEVAYLYLEGQLEDISLRMKGLVFQYARGERDGI